MKLARTIFASLSLALLSACGEQGVVTPEVSPPHRNEERCGYLGSNNCPEARTPEMVTNSVRKPHLPQPIPPQAR